jgi:glycosyltransferase involved in cell wall biosynthesis
MVIGRYAPIVGGAEVQARRLAEALVRRGHSVTVLTGRWSGVMPAEEAMDGVRVRRLSALRNGLGVRGLRRLGWMWFARQVRSELELLADETDVIHAHQLLEPAVAAVAAAQEIGKPVIGKMSSAGVTGDPRVLRERSGEAAWERLRQGLTRLVAVSAAVERDARAAGFTESRIARIPNGAPIPPWRKEDYTGDRRVVCVSRCRPEKGVDVLLKAVRLLMRSLAGLRLDVVGGGELQPALEREARVGSYSHAIAFHGDVADVTPFLRSADVFALPSHTEGLSNALLEAMSVALPCVATNVGGNPDLIEPEVTGLLCEPGDPASLADALKRLLVDDGLRARVGRAAREKVERDFSLDSVAARYESLYAELVRDA